MKSETERNHPFQVVGWDKNFEGSKSKTYDNKSTCQMPTKHGLGYRHLIRHPNGPALFGAWCSLIQVLSRHPKKREGYLTDTGRIQDRHLTDTDLEILTGIPANVYKELFQVAASESVGWLRIPDGYQTDTTVPLHSDPDSDPDLDLNPDTDSNPNANAENLRQRNLHSALPPDLQPPRIQLVSPTLAEVQAWGEMHGVTKAECRAYWQHFQSVGWVTATNIPIRDWKARLSKWREDNKSRKFNGSKK